LYGRYDRYGSYLYVLYAADADLQCCDAVMLPAASDGTFEGITTQADEDLCDRLTVYFTHLSGMIERGVDEHVAKPQRPVSTPQSTHDDMVSLQPITQHRCPDNESVWLVLVAISLILSYTEP
jgi:hypothetical protein